MPVRPALTWEPKSKRWFKRFKLPGSSKFTTFCISARKLAEQTGCKPTMSGSLEAANRWWLRKQDELSDLPLVATSDGMRDLAEAAQSMRRTAAAARAIGDTYSEQVLLRAAAELRRRVEANLPLADTIYDPESGELQPSVSGRADRTPRERLAPIVTSARENAIRLLDLSTDRDSGRSSHTVKALVESYFVSRRVEAENGQLSLNRWNYTRYTLRRFQTFVGDSIDIAKIDGGTLVKYRDHLLSSDISAWHAHDCLSTCRTFLRWLWESEILESLPRNINSRSLRIPVPNTPPKTFTVDEVKTLLEHAPERMKLYALLQLNCGFQASDVSTLRPDEVDWNARTITRARAKTSRFASAPIVCYPIWTSTYDLLKKFKSADPERLLLDHNGQPLKVERINENGNLTRQDRIAIAFR
jgi:integrase